jgi:hypothetical protein
MKAISLLKCRHLGDKGKSNKPARILLVGTRADSAHSGAKKNVVGEWTSASVDKLVGEVLNEYGNVFNIHAHAFIVDANVSNSPSLKAFKAALSDIKSEIIDVSDIFIVWAEKKPAGSAAVFFSTKGVRIC